MTARHFATLALALASAFATPSRGAESAWSNDVGVSFAAARASGRPILVDLYAEWCGWCKTLEARVFSTPEFAAYARDFELLRVDVEDGGDGSELAGRYGSNSLPTLLVLEPTGALVGAVVGYHEAPAFLAQIRNTFASHQRFLAGYASALSATDPDAVRAAAGELHRRADGGRAEALYARLIELVSPTGDELAWLRFYRADALRLARRFDDARREAEVAARAGAGTRDLFLAERLELLPFWIARDAERCGDALEVLASFQERHPRSAFLPGARSALERLRGGGASCS